MSIKNSSDIVHLPVCSAVPPPTEPPRTPIYGIRSYVINIKSNIAVHIKVWADVHLSEKTHWDVAQSSRHSSLTDGGWSVHTLFAFFIQFVYL